MGILDGIVEWIAEQIMYGLDMINTSVLGALGCDMNTFLRYFPAAETMYSLLVALAIGLILLVPPLRFIVDRNDFLAVVPPVILGIIVRGLDLKDG